MKSKKVWCQYQESNGSGNVKLLDASSKGEALEALVWWYQMHLTSFERRHVWQLFAFRVLAYKPETPEDVEKLETMQADGVGWAVDGWLLDSPPDGCPWDSASDTVNFIFNGERSND